MSVEEMDNMFDVLYNNITSNQAPGLNAYEKSIFLTKAQDEIIKNYFNSKSKGNLTQEGFDGNPKRQIDFSSLVENLSLGRGDGEDSEFLPDQQGAKIFSIPTNKILFILNEWVTVDRRDKEGLILQVVPLSFTDYTRLMSKPYKRPLKNQAWRIQANSTVYPNQYTMHIIVGPNDTITSYTMRYVKKPTPIIVDNLDGLSIEGKHDTLDCILDSSLHEEIVQRAVELAKIAWTSTGQDNLQAVLTAGQRNE